MRATLRVRRFDPETSSQPYWQDYEIDWEPGEVVLYALHDIHENQDATLAYRYSCRGAICGSCAMRINGAAALACKVQLSSLEAGSPVVLEPLLNMDVVKDLVVDQEPFFASLRTIMPWLEEGGRDPREEFTLEEMMDAPSKDQFLRATDCIMCQCCFSDCPKRSEDAGFLGPATCLSMYKRTHHPQARDPSARLRKAGEPGGVFDCERHSECNRVCPKKCRPMSAIILLDRRARREGLGVEDGERGGASAQ